MKYLFLLSLLISACGPATVDDTTTLNPPDAACRCTNGGDVIGYNGPAPICTGYVVATTACCDAYKLVCQW